MPLAKLRGRKFYRTNNPVSPTNKLPWGLGERKDDNKEENH